MIAQFKVSVVLAAMKNLRGESVSFIFSGVLRIKEDYEDMMSTRIVNGRTLMPSGIQSQKEGQVSNSDFQQYKI